METTVVHSNVNKNINRDDFPSIGATNFVMGDVAYVDMQEFSFCSTDYPNHPPSVNQHNLSLDDSFSRDKRDEKSATKKPSTSKRDGKKGTPTITVQGLKVGDRGKKLPASVRDGPHKPTKTLLHVTRGGSCDNMNTSLTSVRSHSTAGSSTAIRSRLRSVEQSPLPKLNVLMKGHQENLANKTDDVSMSSSSLPLSVSSSVRGDRALHRDGSPLPLRVSRSPSVLHTPTPPPSFRPTSRPRYSTTQMDTILQPSPKTRKLPDDGFLDGDSEETISEISFPSCGVNGVPAPPTSVYGGTAKYPNTPLFSEYASEMTRRARPTPLTLPTTITTTQKATTKVTNNASGCFVMSNVNSRSDFSMNQSATGELSFSPKIPLSLSTENSHLSKNRRNGSTASAAGTRSKRGPSITNSTAEGNEVNC
ncbi:hypothetical protein AGDE_15119 [Angomonas deanei]|uniref:Uncharacterized protein n=1 Tax=Angomonas deanei TaxID=59799 RepID=A0A7G2CIL2_9TRYP|nr:hypothetical protein AGDE_15119 [Angomonas deanei]CAD2219616.1 hypothetical protein, conserved [Angomonas deanei]|eukprot:EPY19663.1 hypothetical protein AGDE_15119 [Angomonas deanei]